MPVGSCFWDVQKLCGSHFGDYLLLKKNYLAIGFRVFFSFIWKIKVWTSASVDFTVVGTAGLGRGSPTLRALLAPFRFTAPIASRFAAAALRFAGAADRALAATDEGTGAAGAGAGLDRTGMGAKAGELGSGDTSRVKGFSLSALAIRVTRGRPSPAITVVTETQTRVCP